MEPNVFELVADFCERLDHAGIRYVVGGSIASGIWGEPRYTNDADIEVWLSSENSRAFRHTLGEDYEISETDLVEALNTRDEFASVQALNIKWFFKFDCFVGNRTSIDEEAYGRSKLIEIVPGRKVRVASPEHIVVQKLRWFNAGNRVSEKQWRDLSALANVQLDMDWALVDRWVNEFGLLELARELRSTVR